MKFGTWNVWSFYRSGSLTRATRILARYKLYLVGVQEIRCNKVGTVGAGDVIFFHGKGNENQQFGTEFFVHRRIVPKVKKVEFLNDRLP